jgi:hypothetical protein
MVGVYMIEVKVEVGLAVDLTQMLTNIRPQQMMHKELITIICLLQVIKHH